MLDTLLTLLGVVVTGVFGVIGWVMSLIFKKFDDHQKQLEVHSANHEDLSRRLEDHRLYTAETFTPKVEILRMEEKLSRQLDRIEDKLDRKVDK